MEISRSLFWLLEEAWAAIKLRLPKNQPGARPVYDRRVVSGIIHILKRSRRWADCLCEYSPSTTDYNRWNRSSCRAISTRIMAALTEEGWIAETDQIDSSCIKAHLSASNAKRVGRANAIGISRGSRKTKIHTLVSVLG